MFLGSFSVQHLLSVQESGGQVWNVRGSSLIYAMRYSLKPEVRQIAANIDGRDTFFTYTGDFPWTEMDGLLSNGTGGGIIMIEDFFYIAGNRIFQRLKPFNFIFYIKLNLETPWRVNPGIGPCLTG